MSAQAVAPQFVKIGKKPIPEKLAKSRAAVARAAAPQICRAAKTTNYYWEITDYDTNAGQWQEGGTQNYTYNINGQVTSAGSEYEKIVYEYDAEGRCISETQTAFDGQGFVPSGKTEYKYDTVVKNLVTEEMNYYYQDGSWNQNTGRHTEITRNADGNITKVVEKSYYSYNESAAWHEESAVEIAYSADKKASAMTVSEFDYDTKKLEPVAELVDIVWERTDGQIAIFDTDEADFYLGANRIKSAKAPKATNYPYAGDIFYTITYKANDGGYVMNATLNGTRFAWQDYTVVDAYGSFTDEEFGIDYDYDEDNGVYVPDGPRGCVKIA